MKLKIDLIDKKLLLRSTSGVRNLNSTTKSLSMNIQQKETQLLVLWFSETHTGFKGISDAPVQCFVPWLLYTFLSAQTVVYKPNVLAMVCFSGWK